MNYRHAFHAGNFADVIKHTVLTRVLTHLAEKPAAFRVIDTHAGAGRYDLGGAEASRTGEWRDGIGRLRGATLDAESTALLAPYLDAVAKDDGGGLRYPGSPALALALMRPQDRLTACELEPKAAADLSRLLSRDRRAGAVAIDGWTALSAYVPPKERRGLVLVDPPFEQPDEFGRLVAGLETLHRKWATGVVLLWYPVKEPREVAGFIRRIAKLNLPKVLRVELTVAHDDGGTRLRGAGLIAVNPPWRLHGELQHLLPVLAGILSRDGARQVALQWLGDPPAARRVESAS